MKWTIHIDRVGAFPEADPDEIEVCLLISKKVELVRAADESVARALALGKANKESAAAVTPVDGDYWMVASIPVDRLDSARFAFPNATILPLEIVVWSAVKDEPDTREPELLLDRAGDRISIVALDSKGAPMGAWTCQPDEKDFRTLLLAREERLRERPDVARASFDLENICPPDEVGLRYEPVERPFIETGLSCQPEEFLSPAEAEARIKEKNRRGSLRRSFVAAAAGAILAFSWWWIDSQTARLNEQSYLLRNEVARLTEQAKILEARTAWFDIRRRTPFFVTPIETLLSQLPPGWVLAKVDVSPSKAHFVTLPMNGHTPGKEERWWIRNLVKILGPGWSVQYDGNGFLFKRRPK